jgi:hypothetical protein
MTAGQQQWHQGETITAVLMARVAGLRADIEDRRARLAELEVQLSHPSVIPVMHYMEHGASHDDPLCETRRALPYGLLREAYGMLCGFLDNGLAWPIGVSVGGHKFTTNELIAEFGDPTDS